MSAKEKCGGRRPAKRPEKVHAKSPAKGQVTTEYILMAIVVIIGAQFAFNKIKDKDRMTDLLNKPSEMIGNMMENGVWDDTPASARGRHPNHHERHLTIDPYP